ncbi:MAG: AlkZ-related protein [Armatimonadota bacterium]
MDISNWREAWRGEVRTPEDLVRFVDAVGFCSINALERFPAFPSVALAMGRPDALWHAWWWKDDLHVQKRLYYTRLFANRPGFISMKFLPAFIAANGAAADELILLGRIPATTQTIYRMIDAHGPISTRPLKKLLGPDERKAATSELWELERRFIITKTEITGRELATYSYVWDLAERWLPAAFVEADRLKRKAATELIADHLASLGVPLEGKLKKSVLRWEA